MLTLTRHRVQVQRHCVDVTVADDDLTPPSSLNKTAAWMPCARLLCGERQTAIAWTTSAVSAGVYFLLPRGRVATVELRRASGSTKPRQPHLQASASPRLCMNREWESSANQILKMIPVRDVTVSHCATESLGRQGKNDWLGVADLQTPRSLSALEHVFELHECLEARATSGKRNDEHAKSAVYLPLAIKCFCKPVTKLRLIGPNPAPSSSR